MEQAAEDFVILVGEYAYLRELVRDGTATLPLALSSRALVVNYLNWKGLVTYTEHGVAPTQLGRAAAAARWQSTLCGTAVVIRQQDLEKAASDLAQGKGG